MQRLKLRKWRVLELMEKAGYEEQTDLAEALGITRQYLNALLNGRRTPTTDQLVMLCQMLGAQSIDDIAEYPRGPIANTQTVALAGVAASVSR